MPRQTRRAGAFASAAMLFFAIFVSAEGSGAYAQSEGEIPVALAAATLVGEAAAPTQADDQVRFVSSAVVQELPVDTSVAELVAGATHDHASLRELVDATSSDGELAGELKCLAQAVYFEARGEPLEGQLAVARVVVNRSASGQFPANYCGVVTQRAQFSFVRRGRIPEANEGSGAWRRAVRIARIAHQDLWPSDVGNALYFHAGHVRPGWAGRKVAMATIDSHIFYR
jgi:spore germination cell wall hydrolase CwlJ-like protein